MHAANLPNPLGYISLPLYGILSHIHFILKPQYYTTTNRAPRYRLQLLTSYLRVRSGVDVGMRSAATCLERSTRGSAERGWRGDRERRRQYRSRRPAAAFLRLAALLRRNRRFHMFMAKHRDMRRDCPCTDPQIRTKIRRTLAAISTPSEGGLDCDSSALEA